MSCRIVARPFYVNDGRNSGWDLALRVWRHIGFLSINRPNHIQERYLNRPFERYVVPPADKKETTRPSNCPECGSRAVGTLAKVITADTYWRCAGCGAVWNEKRRQP